MKRAKKAVPKPAQSARAAASKGSKSWAGRFGMLIAAGILLMVVWVGIREQVRPMPVAPHPSAANSPLAPIVGGVLHPSQELKPATLEELLQIPPADLGQVDIARMNLLCATGLPGAEGMNIGEMEAKLDEWARWANHETLRHAYKFRDDPADYKNSEGYFRMLSLVTVLQLDRKVQYYPDLRDAQKVPDDVFFADSRHVFLNGLLGPEISGTCSSMPVLYVAVGRRLGYPLKLVGVKAHLLARWDDPAGERFNVEGAGRGFSDEDDEYYKKWPYPITEEEYKAGKYLRSMSPSQELATFLRTRAACLSAAGRFEEAREAVAQARKLHPVDGDKNYLAMLEQRMAEKRLTANRGVRRGNPRDALPMFSVPPSRRPPPDPNLPPDPTPRPTGLPPPYQPF